MFQKKIVTGTFEQRVSTFFSVKNNLPSNRITTLAVGADGRVWVGTDNGLACVENGKIRRVKGLKGAIQALFTAQDGTVWAACGTRVMTVDGQKEQAIAGEAVNFAQETNGTLRLMTKHILYTWNGEKFVETMELDGDEPALAMSVFGGGETYVAAGSSLMTLFGKRARWFAITPERSDLPQGRIQAVAGDDYGMIWVGTSEGLLLYDSHDCWLTRREVSELTSENVTKILFGKTGNRYVGTTAGLIRYSGAEQNFYTAARWLPCAEVTAIAENADGTQLWVGTANGLSRIDTFETTLAEKAKHITDTTEQYNVREPGFIAVRNLTDPQDFSSGEIEISDNDGLWTGCYMASQCYRYAVTGEEEALNLARRSMKCMLKLMKITGISGFTARAIRRPGDDGYGNADPEWAYTEDENGAVEWKGETSSDEMVGHFFSSSVYFDLCADETEKQEISQAICAIADHIIEHDFRLHDKDGKPTTWANWNPTDLNRSDRWYWEHGINSLELLSIMKIAHHMSGNEKYNEIYKHFIMSEHYALNAAHHKRRDCHSIHIDDNLGFLISIPLLTYETDPALRQYYLFGMKDHWQYEQVEHSPLWNLIYGAFSGQPCDLDWAADGLMRLPYDLLSYNVKNSIRRDLDWDEGQEKYAGVPQLKVALPYDEKPINRYDGSPLMPDDYHINRPILYDGAIYLLPYWFGRYNDLLE